MPVTKFLARDLSIAIYNGALDTEPLPGDADWLDIGGLNTLSHAPALARADTTTFDSNGFDEHLPASRGLTWTLAGYTLEDVETGERDPGQVAVEDLGKLVGPAGLEYFKVTSPGGNVVIFQASAEVTLAGGGHNDAATWQAVVTATGEPTFIPVESS
jgi:hypothetical protein